jgi:predicted aldo/keto reductase-like oxidoreductase
MNYRKLGRTGLLVSEIGMGLEHLLDKDEETVIETIRAAVNGGVNYFDCLPLSEFSETSGTNESYVKLGKAIEGIRSKIYLTFLGYTSRPLSYVQADFECFLRELKTDYADIFILACCDKNIEFDEVIKDGGLLDYAKKQRENGRVKYIALSTHNTEIAHKVIESGEFDVLMYPINPAFDVIGDEEKYNSDILGNIWDEAFNYKPDGKSGVMPRKDIYHECERNNIGLVGMKPFAGGFVLNVEKSAGFTPLNLISYVLSQNGVSTVIPGCACKSEIEEILTYYTCPKSELDYSEAVSKSRWTVKGSCLYCNHCLPCSAGINIGEVNKSADGLNRSVYDALPVKASACTECGECMKRCPFSVDIAARMKHAVNLFETRVEGS